MLPTITAITIIYNEEKLLDRCLSSVYGVVDQIMVFHDGPCGDRSLEIAKKYTDKVIILDHRGYIEAHMAEVLSRVNTDWVLILDADEYLSKDLRNDIKKLAEDERADGYSFLEPIYIPDENRYTYDVKPRRKNALLRMNKFYYIGLMHSGYMTYGNLKFTDYILEHKPSSFNFTFSSYLSKWRRLAKMDAAGNFKSWFEIKNFNYMGPDIRLVKKNVFKKNHPLIAIPIVFLTHFFRLLGSVKLFSRAVYYFAFLEALYGATVCYYLYKIKKDV